MTTKVEAYFQASGMEKTVLVRLKQTRNGRTTSSVDVRNGYFGAEIYGDEFRWYFLYVARSNSIMSFPVAKSEGRR